MTFLYLASLNNEWHFPYCLFLSYCPLKPNFKKRLPGSKAWALKKIDFEMACCLYLKQKLLLSLCKASNPWRALNLYVFHRSLLSTEENRFLSAEAKFSLLLHLFNWGIFSPSCSLGLSVALWLISHSQIPEVMNFGGSMGHGYLCLQLVSTHIQMLSSIEVFSVTKICHSGHSSLYRNILSANSHVILVFFQNLSVLWHQSWSLRPLIYIPPN